MSVDIKNIGVNGFTAAAEVVGLVVDLPTAVEKSLFPTNLVHCYC